MICPICLISVQTSVAMGAKHGPAVDCHGQPFTVER